MTMKILKETTEVSGEGLEALLGQQIMINCPNYIYVGKLVGISATYVKLTDAKVVYETWVFTEKGYKDVRNLPGDFFYVAIPMIESFGPGRW